MVGGSVAGGIAAALGHSGIAGQGTPVASPEAAAGNVPAMVKNQPTGEFPLTEEKETLRVLVATNVFVGDFEDNEFTRWYEEHTNVHVEWTVLPSEDAQTALNVRLAGGDYPDVLMSINPTPSIQQVYGAQGVFLPLNDLIEEHGTFTKHVFEQYPVARENSTATDGNIYSLPSVNDCYHCSMAQKLWIYQPWLDALGLNMPQTLDEFEQVLLAFKENDPNGNGEADEMPLATYLDGWNSSLDAFFMNSFLFNPASRIFVDNGTVQFSYNQEGWREGIKYLNRMYQQGLISAESFTQDLQAIQSLAAAEPAQLGAFPGGSAVVPLEPRGAEYSAVPPLEGPDGTRIAAWDPNDAAPTGQFIITDKCENPELAFRWADGLYEIETTTRSNFGVKDVDWRWATPDEVGINGEQAVWTRLVVLEADQQQCWSQTGPSYRSNEWRLGESIDPNVPPEYQQEVVLYNETKEKYEPYQQPAEMSLPTLYFDEEQSLTLSELSVTIDPYVEETFTLGILGDVDIDAEWENYLATLDQLGVSQLQEIYQSAYDAKTSSS